MIKWEKIKKNKNFINKDESINLEVGKEGFCLWIKEEGVWHWIIDCSRILETMEIILSKNPLWNIRLVRQKGMKWDVHSRYIVLKEKG